MHDLSKHRFQLGQEVIDIDGGKHGACREVAPQKRVRRAVDLRERVPQVGKIRPGGFVRTHPAEIGEHSPGAGECVFEIVSEQTSCFHRRRTARDSRRNRRVPVLI